jgi:hypothetical protein
MQCSKNAYLADEFARSYSDVKELVELLLFGVACFLAALLVPLLFEPHDAYIMGLSG